MRLGGYYLEIWGDWIMDFKSGYVVFYVEEEIRFIR